MAFQEMTITVTEPVTLKVVVAEDGEVILTLPGHRIVASRELAWKIRLEPGSTDSKQSGTSSFTGVKSSSGRSGVFGRSGTSGVAAPAEVSGHDRRLTAPPPSD